MGVFAIIIASFTLSSDQKMRFFWTGEDITFAPFFRKLKSLQNDKLACNVQELKLMRNKKMSVNK